MSAALKASLDRTLRTLEVAAWGVRLSDGSTAIGRFNDWLPESRIDQALSRLGNAVENLARHGLKPERLCWTFELARVHFAIRPDGASLAVFVKNDRKASPDALQAFLEEFVRGTEI